uniref:DUF4789 domain-containing protein n=1 Tax=Heterorhabditis bacteriophora TaxID=37862 RepID=A0A1I7X2C1_HETBA
MVKKIASTRFICCVLFSNNHLHLFIDSHYNENSYVSYSQRKTDSSSTKGTSLEAICPVQQLQCKGTKYRLPDGRCTNVLHPEWGASLSIFQRYLPPQYGDGKTTTIICIKRIINIGNILSFATTIF